MDNFVHMDNFQIELFFIHMDNFVHMDNFQIELFDALMEP